MSSQPAISDYDSYPEVDQALLRRELPAAFEWPRIVDVEAYRWPATEEQGLAAEVAALRPGYVVARVLEPSQLEPWARLDRDGSKVHPHHLASSLEVPLESYEGLCSGRLVVDLTNEDLQDPNAYLKRYVSRSAMALKIVLRLDESDPTHLAACLDTIGREPGGPREVVLLFDGFSPPDPAFLGRLGAIALDGAGRTRVTGLNYYRIARLHLYYRLPLLRLCVRPDKNVLPLPSCPLPLGNLREASLAEIWQSSRTDFWGRPEVLAYFETRLRDHEIARRAS